MPPSAIEVEGVRDTEGIPLIQQPLSINGFTARREKAGRLVAGTAAYTSSDFFKGPTEGKPKAKRWDRESSMTTATSEPKTNARRLPQHRKQIPHALQPERCRKVSQTAGYDMPNLTFVMAPHANNFQD
jgi:hypothetical protein